MKFLFLSRPFAIAALFLHVCASALQAASDVTVSAAGTTDGVFSGGNPNVFTATATPAVASTATIQQSLNGGNAVTVSTVSAAAGNGDLTVVAGISKTAGGSSLLTLQAERDLAVNGFLFANSGAMPLALTAGRNMTNSQSITTNGGNITLTPTQVFTVGAAISAGAGTVAIPQGVVESTLSQTITGSSVHVAASAALRFQGTINAALTVAGTVSPMAGSGTGGLQVSGALALQDNSKTVIDINGTSEASSFDRINATGAITISPLAVLEVNVTPSFHDAIARSTVFTIIRGGSVTGTFSGYLNGSRYTLPNDFGSFRVNYNGTAVTLDDWQPVIVNLTWDPGTAEAGTAVFTNTNTRGGRHYFRVTTQGTDVGAWRSRLTLAPGSSEAALYLSKTNLPTVGGAQFSSAQVGGDGLMLRDDQFAAAEEWFILVYATPGAQWSLFSGRAFVHDLGVLPYTDVNGNSQYDIGEGVSPQVSPATAMPPEGIRFYRSTVPIGTPAWSLWLNGSTREIALRTTKVPFHSQPSYYTRKQAGQMLVVPTVLGTGSNAYFLSVVAPQGEVIGLDSRIQAVTDIAFQSTTANVAVTGAPYRVFRTTVPIDQLAWDVSTTALVGNPNVCLRKNNVPGEWDNEAYSSAAGSVTDSVTLVPDYLTSGTWFITVYGTGNYTFTLKSGDPVITPLNFTNLKTNDQPTRAGWRFYALTDIPTQVGTLGWELTLANHVPGTQIAIRRNKVPSRWIYRANGNMSTPSDIGTSYMDFFGSGGFLQRPGHQADVWYVGIYLPEVPLGAFDLDVHPIVPAYVGFDGTSTAIAGLAAGKWAFQRIDVPAGVLGWDLRVKNVVGGTPRLVVRRDQLPSAVGTGGSWAYPFQQSNWPSGNSWGGREDWSGRINEANVGFPLPEVGNGLVMGMGRPLEPGTYYVGVFNSHSTNSTDYQVQSRGIGSGQSLTVADLNFAAGSSATITNLARREAAYFKVTIPANTPSWEFTLAPSVGEMMVAMRRGTVPDFDVVDGNGFLDADVQNTGTTGSRQVEIQKAGPERFVVLPRDNAAFIVAGDYYIAVVSEGVNPPNANTIGTGTSSGVLTSLGTLATTDLGDASAAGIGQFVSLLGAQVKSFKFNVPVGTASLEVRLDNRVGNPQMALISGEKIPQPSFRAELLGYNGGQTTMPVGGVARVTNGNLITIANPPVGTYSLTLRADTVSNLYPDASADLVIVANAPVPLNFDGATATVSGQSPTAWRYFTVTVPAGVVGWDVRLKNVTSGTPRMVIRRDQLPSVVSTTGTWSTPYNHGNWASGNSWRGQVDWTLRNDDDPLTNGTQQVQDRLVAGMGRPLEPGTYYVGVYNEHASTNAAYQVESRGIGAGQTLPVTDLNFAAGSSANITALAPREAAYFKVTIPANTPSWEFTLAPSAGEMMLAMRRGTVPDFHVVDGVFQDADVQFNSSSQGSRQVKIQKDGRERFVVLPRTNAAFIVPGDYYIAVISEGVNPPNTGTIGTGTSSGVLTSLGTLGTSDLGNASLPPGAPIAVSLEGAQVKSFAFNVPEGTASLEVRLDNRVGNPQMALIGGTKIPQPSQYSEMLGYNGGQTTPPVGGATRVTNGNLITIANPPAGPYSLTVRADSAVNGLYPLATADLFVVANAPVPLAFDGGVAPVSGQSPTAWRYFSVTVPAGVVGWDVRLKNVTSGTPRLVVRRDQLPSVLGTNWTPYTTNAWPSGNSWGGQVDWSGRNDDNPLIGGTQQVTDALVMAMGRPLEPGTYFIGVYNEHASAAAAYTVESRGIGAGRTLSVTDLNFTAGSSASITALAPREAAYFKVTIPANTPSWEFTLDPSVGEMMMAMRRDTVPDFNADIGSSSRDANVQFNSNNTQSRQVKIQKAGPERFVVLPHNNAAFIFPGDYYIAVISEGVNPSNTNTIGTGTSSGVLASLGSLVTPSLGEITAADTPIPVILAGAQVKSYNFKVPFGTAILELRLDNRVGNPQMALISGNHIPQPGNISQGSDLLGFNGGYYTQPAGGVSRILDDNLITVANPPSGIYTLSLYADSLGGLNPDATANLVIRQVPRLPLAFDGGTATRQLLDTQKDFFEVHVPDTLGGEDGEDVQPVIGWLIKVNHLQGDTTLKIYNTWGNSSTGITVNNNTALVVPPFLTLCKTWFVEVQGTGLTNYTITSQPVLLERPVWTMPAGHNATFGDSGNNSVGIPLPGDRGIDIGQDDWHFFAIDVPEGNAGLLRTELQAINGNPNLYIREDGVPTTDHNSTGVFGSSLVNRSLTSTASEYGNWVPLNGRYQKQLRAGRWYLGVKASGTSNARYRLIVSNGQVSDLALSGGSANSQILVGRDWRYYRFTVPTEAPINWNLTFSQQVGDVNMWLRDTIPPGNSGDGLGTTDTFFGETGLRTWSYDSKNQGPYSSSGHDAAGTYVFNTPALRPGHTYYVGFRAANDASFSLSSSTSGGTIGVLPTLDFYTGTIDTTIPAGGSTVYRIPVPPEATRMKWTATHPSSVQLRLEQGTLPGATGSQHWTSGASANTSFNQALTTPNNWPWQPNHVYYLRVSNTSGASVPVILALAGKNASNEDEDNDGLPDAWERDCAPYAAWQSARFTPLALADPLISGPSADPDLDGLANIIEFAFGLNPNSGASMTIPAAMPVGENFVVSFTQPAGVGGIVYMAEWSPTMAVGSWLPVPDSGAGAVHTFSVPICDRPAMFMRLKVLHLCPP